MSSTYSLGLDYGTNTVRALLARIEDGEEVASSVFAYPHGDEGVLGDDRQPDLARQHPKDYLEGLRVTIPDVMTQASRQGIGPEQVIGIGVDTTGSTPLPLDAEGRALATLDAFEGQLDAMAWLWKDHTAKTEAEEITSTVSKAAPHIIARCGGTYSSEWFFSKILRCLRSSPAVFEAAHTWIELADWIPAVLTGRDRTPGDIVRGICAAGHKAMFLPGEGLPNANILSKLAPELGALRSRLFDHAETVDKPAGTLSAEWAKTLGLREGTPVAVGALDAHMGGVGSGIRPGRLVKILGTSTCDMFVSPSSREIGEIPGLCGIVDGSILPGFWGLEAGQSAVGDLFQWFVRDLAPHRMDHEALNEKALALAPGASGLLALDWNNGNRCILTDPSLSGLLLGQSLRTRPEEIYRALIEATAFGARVIMDRMEESGSRIEEVVCCGGIAEKSPLVMQIYADVCNRPMAVARSSQTCALGSAIAGACVGSRRDFLEVQAAMTGSPEKTYQPNDKAHGVYQELFALYRDVHDAFGKADTHGSLHHVMKRLIAIRERTR